MAAILDYLISYSHANLKGDRDYLYSLFPIWPPLASFMHGQDGRSFIQLQFEISGNKSDNAT